MTDHDRVPVPAATGDEAVIREDVVGDAAPARKDHATPGGAAAAGAVTGGAVGGVVAGPIGAVVGAVGGALAGVAAERGMHADDEGTPNMPDSRGGPIVTGTGTTTGITTGTSVGAVPTQRHTHTWQDNRCADCGTARV